VIDIGLDIERVEREGKLWIGSINTSRSSRREFFDRPEITFAVQYDDRSIAGKIIKKHRAARSSTLPGGAMIQ
jgi:hypothetical protein